jgi:hypothetical protein
MKWICSILVAALLLQIGYVPCAALDVAPGSRMRVEAPSMAEHRLTGTLMKVGVDSLVLMREDLRRLAVPLASLTKIEVHSGKRTKAKFGAVLGLLVGGTTSVLLFDLSETVTYTKQVGVFPYFSTSVVTRTITENRVSKSGLIALVTVAFTSALFGGAIGSNFKEWKRLPLPGRIGITPQPQGGLALSTSFSF